MYIHVWLGVRRLCCQRFMWLCGYRRRIVVWWTAVNFWAVLHEEPCVGNRSNTIKACFSLTNLFSFEHQVDRALKKCVENGRTLERHLYTYLLMDFDMCTLYCLLSALSAPGCFAAGFRSKQLDPFIGCVQSTISTL